MAKADCRAEACAYDRYLAEVFLQLAKGEGKAQPLDKLEAVSLSNRQDCARASTEEIFLNNALLENGHAVRMDGSAPLEL